MTKRYFLAFAVPQLEALRVATEEYLLSRGISLKRGGSSAHLTVKGPMSLDEAGRERFVRNLVTYLDAGVFYQTKMRVGSLGFFENVRNIHVGIDDEAFVQHWRLFVHTLHTKDAPQREYEGRTPHITLATIERVADFERAKALAQVFVREHLEPLVLDFSKLVLYEKAGSESLWREGTPISLCEAA